jgi:hypothetical protein
MENGRIKVSTMNPPEHMIVMVFRGDQIFTHCRISGDKKKWIDHLTDEHFYIFESDEWQKVGEVISNKGIKLDDMPTENEKSSEVTTSIKTLTFELSRFLIAKNIKYGNSALSPLSIFAKGMAASDKINTRIDDKLSRVKNSDDLKKNDVIDLIGYLMLLAIDNGWTNLDDLID